MKFNFFDNHIKLDELFRYDKKSNSYIVDISVDDYRSLYSELDFSPVKSKDLDDKLVEYLEESIEDIPMKYNLIIDIHMPNGIFDSKREEKGKEEIKHYFEYLKRKKEREIHSYYRAAMMNFVLGVFFIFIVSLIKKNLSTTLVIWEIVLEGFYVGGWVFLWEFFSLIFLEPHKEKERVKQYKRVLNSKIRYSYCKEKNKDNS